MEIYTLKNHTSHAIFHHNNNHLKKLTWLTTKYFTF